METEITLLRQLHLQAQTEMLALEERNWDLLEGILEDKDRLVQQILQAEETISKLIRPAASLSGFFSPELNSKARVLKQEGIELVQSLNRAEKKNRTLLEVIRKEAMKEAQQLQQAQRIFQAYQSRKKAPPIISKLVE
jgi:hypothetical protein